MTTIQFALTTHPSAEAGGPLTRIRKWVTAAHRWRPVANVSRAARPSDQAMTMLSARDRLTERH